MEIFSLNKLTPQRFVVNQHNLGTLAHMNPLVFSAWIERCVMPVEAKYRGYIWRHRTRGVYSIEEVTVSLLDATHLVSAIDLWRKNPKVENGDAIALALSVETRTLLFRRLELLLNSER